MNEAKYSYKNLDVYKESKALVKMVYDLFFIQAFCTLPHLHIKMKPGSLDVTESGPMRFLKVVGGW